MASPPSPWPSWQRRRDCSTGWLPTTWPDVGIGRGIDLNLGPALRTNQQLVEAEEAAGQAIALYDALVVEQPKRPDFQLEQAVAQINLGLIRQSAQQPDRRPVGADAGVGLARRACRKIPRYAAIPRTELARAYNGLAVVAFDFQQRAEGTALFAKAVNVWDDLVAHHDSADYHGELGIALGNHGRAILRDDPSLAKKSLTRGMTELLIGLRPNQAEKSFRGSFRDQSRDLAGLMVRTADRTGALAFARQIANSPPDRVQAIHRAVVFLADCVSAADHQKSPAAEADTYKALAIELVRGAGPADWAALHTDRDFTPLMKRPEFAKALGK